MILLDDHLLLRVLVGDAPDELEEQSIEGIATTTAWWWRAVSPLAAARATAGRHTRTAAALTPVESDALWEALCRVGQPGSLVTMPELVALGPAMAWLARTEGLNRLAAEVVAAAADRAADVWVRRGNEGRLGKMAGRYGFRLHVM